MAALSTTRPVASQSAGQLSHFFADAFAALRDWNDARLTRKSLSQLSNRELDDIGLIRGDIETVVRRTIR